VELCMTVLQECMFAHRYEWRMNLFEGVAFNFVPFGKKIICEPY